MGAAIAYWPELRENIDALPSVLKLIPSETIRNMVIMLEEQGYWAYFGIQHLVQRRWTRRDGGSRSAG